MPISSTDIKLKKSATNPSLGFASGITVDVTDTLNSLFAAVQPQEALDGVAGQYRAVCVYNSSSTDSIVSLKAYFSAQTSNDHTSIEMGVNPAHINMTAITGIPALTNETTAPASVTFSSPTNLASSINLGTIQPGRYTIFYLKRVIAAGAAVDSADICQITLTNAAV